MIYWQDVCDGLRARYTNVRFKPFLAKCDKPICILLLSKYVQYLMKHEATALSSEGLSGQHIDTGHIAAFDSWHICYIARDDFQYLGQLLQEVWHYENEGRIRAARSQADARHSRCWKPNLGIDLHLPSVLVAACCHWLMMSFVGQSCPCPRCHHSMVDALHCTSREQNGTCFVMISGP